MATTSKALARTAAATSSTTLYTVPSGTTTIVTNIVIANTNGTAQTATISLDGVVLIPAVSVPANSVVPVDIKQTLSATKTISGFASSTAVTFHISGVEVN